MRQRFRISERQMKVLKLVERHAVVSQHELYRDLGLTKRWTGGRLSDSVKASVQRSLARLAARGLIESFGDRVFYLTLAGEDFLQNPAFRRTPDSMTEAEIERFWAAQSMKARQTKP